MYTHKFVVPLFSILTVLAFVLSACGAAATPTVAPPSNPTAVPNPIASAVPPTSTVPPTPQKKIVVAFFINKYANSYSEALIQGAIDEVSKVGGTVVVFDANYDATVQVAQMQDALTSGKYNAWIMSVVNGLNILPEVDAAAKAGIAIGTMGTIIGPNPTSFVPYPGVSIVAAIIGQDFGKRIGEKLVEVCADKDPCKVVYLLGTAAQTVDQQRLIGLHSILDTHPNIMVIAEQEANYAQDQALNVMQNILQAHPDINVVASVGDQMSLGAIQAIADAGLTGKVIVLGQGANVQGIKAIQDGTMYATFANIPYTAGQLIADYLIQVVLYGQKGTKSIDLSTVSPPLPASGPWIDKSNVSTFTPQW